MPQRKLHNLVNDITKQAIRTKKTREYSSKNILLLGGLATATLALIGGGTYLYMNQKTARPRRTKGFSEGSPNALKNVI